MIKKRFPMRILLTLVFLAYAGSAWTKDSEDPKDSGSEKEDAPLAGGTYFKPPHDDHIDSTPEHPSHQSGASAAGGQYQR
jgi:hypothetical protein